MIYTLSICDNTYASILENVNIGDYVFIASGDSIGVVVTNKFSNKVLDEYLSVGLITDEVKDLFINSILADEEYIIYPIVIPQCIWGKGIETVDDLKRHLEIHNYMPDGTLSIEYLGGITGVENTTNLYDTVQLYLNNNKLIVIKLIK